MLFHRTQEDLFDSGLHLRLFSKVPFQHPSLTGEVTPLPVHPGIFEAIRSSTFSSAKAGLVVDSYSAAYAYLVTVPTMCFPRFFAVLQQQSES